MRQAPIGIAIALALAAAPLSGCGAEDAAPGAIAEAAEKTVASGGSRVVVDGQIDAAGQEITMTGEGVMDAAGRRARFEYSFDGAPGLGEMQQVMDGYVMYMRMPAFEGGLPEGKSWMKLDLRTALDELGLDASQFGAGGGTDATRMLDYMRTAGDVEKKGEEEVRGVETTRYRAVVNLREYPKLVPEAEREAAERGVETLIEMSGGEAEFPTEVWVDEGNLIRRIRQQMEMAAPGGESFEMDITTELFDFGTPVTIEPPPEDEVQDMTEIAAEQIERQQ